MEVTQIVFQFLSPLIYSGLFLMIFVMVMWSLVNVFMTILGWLRG